jgi:hypothetical protein
MTEEFVRNEFLRDIAAAIRDDQTCLHRILHANLSCIGMATLRNAQVMLSEAFDEEGDPESPYVGPSFFFLDGYLHSRREREAALQEGI